MLGAVKVSSYTTLDTPGCHDVDIDCSPQSQ
jgi:hypothetical protein